MAAAGLAPLAAGEVGVHHVPATGAEAELHRGVVVEHLVAGGDRPGELRQHVGGLTGTLAVGVAVHLDPLQPRRAPG